jgi:hypothetical protein
MIHELDNADFHKALPLYKEGPPTYANMVINAVAEGTTPGRVWVDDPQDPRSCLMWDKGPVYCLAGNAGNAEFNTALATLIRTNIAPTAIARGVYYFKLFYTPGGWDDKLADLFRGATFREGERTLCTFDALKTTAWREMIPNGFSMRLVDADFLGKDSPVNVSIVTEEISCCWASVGTFLERGFGFCLLHNNKIISWCTSEYVSGNNYGIGIATDEEYQGRGFATITASAFVEHCTRLDGNPYWDAWTRNLPSLAVAEKVGFKRYSTYTVYIGEYGTGK